MAQMVANAKGMTGVQQGTTPFIDILATYWGTPVLRQLKAENGINGFADGSFRPDQAATRAEFITMLARVLQL